ncbi:MULTISPECIES: PP2C family protein-serine/threonine phosphatase [Streptomyces]|uniref:PP2C family protein-serine/threonine phosphatase n=1 Tax=Streptomyces flavovirens TaxID=52258 RepID=A0ABV8NAT4_9ACTN|nr:protein phosphatase 2C domain-containing protein [Streptomyces sp. MBT51]MBK3596271.1 protein phosphatase 2C domain-containing protein [Streptomyces sp. MBT51]
MRTHATAQHIGSRSHQCDATATYTHHGLRAYALLDGIGSTTTVQAWTRYTARRLARAAATTCDALVGLTRVYHQAANEPGRDDPFVELPAACAVVAVARTDGILTVAWCGDTRAYLLVNDKLEQLTVDHNMRQLFIDEGLPYGPYARNQVTSYLGNTDTDPPPGERSLIGVTLRPSAGRLLLASDGAYELLEDSCRDLAQYLTGTPAQAARNFTQAAIDHAALHADNATVLITDLEGTS